MRRAESVDIIKNEYAQGGMVVADFLLEKTGFSRRSC